MSRRPRESHLRERLDSRRVRQHAATRTDPGRNASVRMTDAQWAAIDEIARERGYSRSRMLRFCVETALGLDVGAGDVPAASVGKIGRARVLVWRPGDDEPLVGYVESIAFSSDTATRITIHVEIGERG